MNDEEKQEILEEYNQNIEWFKKNIPPEQIYPMAEQLLRGAEFFLRKWCEWVDIQEELEKDKLVNKWISNLVNIRFMQRMKIDSEVKMNVKFSDEL